MSRKRIENNIAYDEGKRKYYVTFHYGIDGNGKRVKKTKTYDTHVAAAEALRIFEMKKRRSEITIPTELTVGMWLDRWLMWCALTGRVPRYTVMKISLKIISSRHWGKRYFRN